MARLKYRSFIRALKIPDGAKARELYRYAVADLITSAAEAKKIFVQTRRADLDKQLRDAKAGVSSSGEEGSDLPPPSTSLPPSA